MHSHGVTDISALLNRISDAQPSGEDMSFSSEFDAIQEARRSDDASLDQGEWITAIKESDWEKSLQLTTSLLTSQTKDLRLASWYTEACAKLHGVGGMARGFTLIRELLDVFWDSVYPLPDDGDMEQRIGNLSWLITRSVQLTRELPLVKGAGQSCGMQEFDAARAHQLLLERSPNTDTTPRVSLQQFKSAQRATPRSFHEEQLENCVICAQAISALAATADQKFGIDGPSFSPLKAALEAYSDALQRVARENGVMTNESQEADPTEVAQDISDSLAVRETPEDNRAAGPLRTRAQALQQLRQVADFFRRTEPHSPVAYLADKAASWGEMPLHVWLKSVLKDESAMARFDELLGVEDLGESS